MSTTSPASRRPPSSGSSALLLAALAGGLIGAAPEPAPVVQQFEDGEIDWTHRVIQVIGVGTPKVLSATGGITTDDPYAHARSDAEARLGRLLARVPVDTRRRLRDVDGYAAIRDRALTNYVAAPARYFSDGTVHLSGRVDLGAVAEALSPPAPAEGEGQAPDAGAGPPGDGGVADADGGVPDANSTKGGPTGLMIQVKGAVEPALRVTVNAASSPGTTLGGLPGDLIGEAGLRWVDDPRAAAPYVGPRPHLITAKPREPAAPGALTVTDPAMWAIVSGGVPGAVVVIVLP